jgi:hypothetical protein
MSAIILNLFNQNLIREYEWWGMAKQRQRSFKETAGQARNDFG